MNATARASKLFRLLTNPSYWNGLAKGVAATTENVTFLRQQNYSLLLDVGANRGQFALASRAVNPQAEIVSFEPVKEAAEKFRTVFARVEGVTLHELAVGAAPGEAKIYIPNIDGGSSMALPLGGGASVRTVKVETLDRIVQNITPKEPILLKLDIQGYELQALKGAEGTLSAVSDLFVEVTFRSLAPDQAAAFEIVEFLRARGFYIHGVYNVVSVGTDAHAADFHFRKLK